ncbi:MAG: recombinase family protein [Bosea sp. (in: a-proteobacteria)]
MRAAVYARYSSEQQSAASIPDQVRLCRRLCEDRGWSIVEVFADEAISGATHLRPDFQRMQQMAMRGGFDVLVAEGLDRLSRDQEHIAGLYKRMGYLGVRIFTKLKERSANCISGSVARCPHSSCASSLRRRIAV